MPWTNQSGGGDSNGGGKGPWGGGPSGRGPQPPDLEAMLRRSQERLKQALPGGGFGSGALIVIVLGIIAVWLATGIYIVNPSEQGVVLRFGKFETRTGPGINYHLPWPIEIAYTPNVTQQNQINIGYRSSSDDAEQGATAASDISEESLMLTGDENIVDINFTVFWVIKDAGQFLFNVENPQQTIKAVAESAMREVVGQNQIEPILTQDREPVQIQVRELMQKTLDAYGAGVTITSVQMQKADPPAEVIDSYRDVQAARSDQESMRNQAEAYANKIIPEARGNAAQIVQDAQAYKQQVIAEADGEAKRFTSVFDEYRKAPDVTRRRMYIETMAHVLGGMNKTIIDSEARGVVPYLPLPALKAGSEPSPAESGGNQ